MYIGSFGGFVLGLIVGAYNASWVISTLHQIATALNIH